MTVHIDPESHHGEVQIGDSQPGDLPTRVKVIEEIKAACDGFLEHQHIDNIILHYLEQGIEVEIILNPLENADVDLDALIKSISNLDYILKLMIFSKLAESAKTRSIS